VWFERGFLPYLSESTLWPVFGTVSLIVMSGLALLVVRSFAYKDVASMMTLALTFLASGLIIQFEREHRRRVGVITGLVGVTWVLTGAISYAAHHFGVY